MDCIPPGSSVQGIFQARVLEWVAIFLFQGIFPTQGKICLCHLHWQADSLLLSHLGSFYDTKPKDKVWEGKVTIPERSQTPNQNTLHKEPVMS